MLIALVLFFHILVLSLLFLWLHRSRYEGSAVIALEKARDVPGASPATLLDSLQLVSTIPDSVFHSLQRDFCRKTGLLVHDRHFE